MISSMREEKNPKLSNLKTAFAITFLKRSTYLLAKKKVIPSAFINQNIYFLKLYLIVSFVSFQAVLSAKNLCLLGENVKLPGYEKYELSSLDSSVTPIKLAKLRRQFLSYTKLNPPSQPDLDKIAASYFEFLNANLKQTQ